MGGTEVYLDSRLAGAPKVETAEGLKESGSAEVGARLPFEDDDDDDAA